MSVTHIAKRYGVTKNAIHKWRSRYSNFPRPVETEPYPRYRLEDVERWHQSQWDSEGALIRIHRWRTTSAGMVHSSTDYQSWEKARGYLHGVRDALFGDWKVYHTKDGFSAHRGNEVEVWVLDPTTAEPEAWFFYDAKFKTGGKVG